MHRRQLISRRTFFRGCAGLFLTPIRKWQASSGKRNSTETAGGLPLTKQFDDSYLCDFSPDGTKLCVYRTKNRLVSFRWDGTWKQLSSPVPAKEDALRIFEIAGWKEIASARLRQNAYLATFFADGKALHAGTAGPPARFVQDVLIDLNIGIQQERVTPFSSTDMITRYHALADRLLLGLEYNLNTGTTDALVQVAVPEYGEIRRVPFAEFRNRKKLWEGERSLSDDRKSFVYTVDNKLVYRRTDDLSMIWQREIEGELLLNATAITADGHLAAVRVGIGQPSWEKGSHIAILDGKDGTSVAHFPIDYEVRTIALSPDHRLLATTQDLFVPALKKQQATAIIYEISSGKEMTRIVYDEFHAEEFLARSGRVTFSPDNRFFVTSGLHTKIWELNK